MHTTLIVALSADGFLAKSKNDRSFNWTSPEDKAFYVSKIKEVDAIVMGRTSFETFSKYPKKSRWLIYTSKPENFVNPSPAVIRAEGTNEKSSELLSRLAGEGVEKVAICGGASIYTAFLQENLVDEMFITVEDVTFGAGISFYNQEWVEKVSFRLKDVKRLGEKTIVLHYMKKS